MEAVYTYSEARQNLATLLDIAANKGEVRIQRRDGQTFVLKPEQASKSPLDVIGIDTDVTAEEIVDFIHEGRREFNGYLSQS